jgi:hypothetical protein
VGTKASNFDDDIKENPRVVMWESQNQHWTDKDLPSNTRAIFMTRFISHAAFGKIVAEARKKQITIFNPEGTGVIARQVRELLALHRPTQTSEDDVKKKTRDETEPKQGRLKALHPFVDFSKTNIENARALLIKAQEMEIVTTEMSLAQMVSNLRKKQHRTGVPKSILRSSAQMVDVSVEILDTMIKSLQDMREYLIATTNENAELRAKLEALRKALGE